MDPETAVTCTFVHSNQVVFAMSLRLLSHCRG